MSKKHYIKFAKFFMEQCHAINTIDFLNGTPGGAKTTIKEYSEAMIKDFAKLLQADNPLFDEQRFLKACGL